MSTCLIKGGKVYNPQLHCFELRDLAVQDGVLAERLEGTDIITVDASDCIVTPGLIDYHVHYFNHGTENGVNPDVASFPCGITTVVDGGSCGAANYELYRKSVMAYSDVRILNALLTASGGQGTDQYPENLEARYFDTEKIKALFRKYPDNLVGLKTRLSKGIIEGKEAEESLEATVGLAEKLNCNVIVHITDPSIPLEHLAARLRPGDVICHAYQSIGETILDDEGRVRSGLQKARARGVLFDASNGRKNYDLDVCKKALEQGFYPDIISSDINSSSCYTQPLHSLPRIMSRYLDMGMSLEQVLDTVTLNPARVLGRMDLVSLESKTTADLAIFKLKKRKVDHRDFAGHTFCGTQILVPQWTMKGGRVMYCQADFC